MLGEIHHLLHVACTHVYVSTSVITFGIAGLFTFVTDPESRQRRGFAVSLANHYFPWAGWRGASVRVDVLFYLIAKYTQSYLILLISVISLTATAPLHHFTASWLHHPAFASFGMPALVLTGLAMFLFADLGVFISHRAQHEIKPLWEFHKIHHASTFLTPLTTFRNHPVSIMIDTFAMGLLMAIPAGIAGALFDFTLADRAMLSGAVSLALMVGPLGILQHTHFPVSFGPLERLFISPLMHQVHHSRDPKHFNKNYGTRLSVWDWMFGTAVILPKGERVESGLNVIEDERGAYTNVIWCYAGPFINCAKMLAGKIRRRPAPALAPVSDINAPESSHSLGLTAGVSPASALSP